MSGPARKQKTLYSGLWNDHSRLQQNNFIFSPSVESRSHTKNGASLKSHMSKTNYLNFLIMTQRTLLTCLICLCIGLVANAQKLDKFGADLGKKSVMGKEIRVPYSDVVSYYGFIKPGATPDETRDGKKYYYLYMWVPVAAPEIGIRIGVTGDC